MQTNGLAALANPFDSRMNWMLSDNIAYMCEEVDVLWLVGRAHVLDADVDVSLDVRQHKGVWQTAVAAT